MMFVRMVSGSPPIAIPPTSSSAETATVASGTKVAIAERKLTSSSTRQITPVSGISTRLSRWRLFTSVART